MKDFFNDNKGTNNANLFNYYTSGENVKCVGCDKEKANYDERIDPD